MVPYVMIRSGAESRNLTQSTETLYSFKNPSPYTIPLLATLAIEEAEVAVPAQRDNIDNQNPVLKWNDLEVDRLNKWPNHPVL
jgi:hypothetical protein